MLVSVEPKNCYDYYYLFTVWCSLSPVYPTVKIQSLVLNYWRNLIKNYALQLRFILKTEVLTLAIKKNRNGLIWDLERREIGGKIYLRSTCNLRFALEILFRGYSIWKGRDLGNSFWVEIGCYIFVKIRFLRGYFTIF